MVDYDEKHTVDYRRDSIVIGMSDSVECPVMKGIDAFVFERQQNKCLRINPVGSNHRYIQSIILCMCVFSKGCSEACRNNQNKQVTVTSLSIKSVCTTVFSI